jgi:hypothetical protein
MAAVFWDRKGVLIMEFMQQGTTITSEVYCRMLKKTVWPFRTKGASTFSCSYLSIAALLENFNWELFDHHPYNTDLALSNYHQFTTRRTGSDHSASTGMRS